ncbi:PBSX family phage terminase large subunit [Chitinophaga tropicalis]|nr:PBSX family phage terminase large subunit [Chitinophaga tropicalis]
MQVVEHKHHFSHLYKPVFTTKARYIHIWGGRAAGRSHFGTSYFLFQITQPGYFRGVFLRHVFSDIRDSLFADFKDRLEESDFNGADFEINESKMTILYKPTGNTIISKGFRKSSGNRSAKLKSLAGITHVLIEEADENTEGDVNKLDDSIRTDKIENIQVIFLYNPPSKNHWLIKRFYNLVDTGILDETGKPIPYYRAIPKTNPDVLVIHSTYRDNIRNLNEKTIKKYQSYGDPESIFYNEEMYYVDVCGLVPEGARGRIYRGWKPVSLEFFRNLPYPSYYGIDFGYSDDPVAVIEIKSHNKRNFWHEVVYEPGLTNPALADLMRVRGVPLGADIYADSAEPKSIQELKDLGFYRIKEADKGPDSVLFGIKQVSAMENYITEGSANLWSENEEYKWKLDQNGEPTNEPVDKNNHAKDAGRYAITTKKQLKRKKKIKVAKTSDSVEAPKASADKSKLDWL